MSVTTQASAPDDVELTVGMPVFNAESYIEEALTSILDQSAVAFRLVVSDNASTDRTLEIVSRLASGDPRVTIIKNSKNIGAAQNYRAVSDACRTPYFMWAAGDDVFDRNWIETLLPLAKSRQALAFGQIAMMNADGSARPHPSAYRNLSFWGPRFFRRISYFIDPGLLGKANPIYGIFPTEQITPAALDELAKPQRGADVMFLYEILKSSQILCDVSVTLQKRHHRQAEAMKPIPNNRQRYFRRTQLPQFWSASKTTERAALLLFYPIAFLMTYAAKIRYLIKRANTR